MQQKVIKHTYQYDDEHLIDYETYKEVQRIRIMRKVGEEIVKIGQSFNCEIRGKSGEITAILTWDINESIEDKLCRIGTLELAEEIVRRIK